MDGARHRLLVSSQDRRPEQWPPGAIWSVPLDPAEDARELDLLGRRDGCSFHPHGIDLVRSDRGPWLLYVLNHHDPGDRSPERGCFDAEALAGAPGGRLTSVEVFVVHPGHLRFVQRLAAPAVLTNGNDLAALPNGDVWVTDPPGGAAGQLLEARGPLRLSRVVRYRCGLRRELRCAGRWIEAEIDPGTEPLRYANGIAYRPGTAGRGDRLYVASGAGARLHVFVIAHRSSLMLLDAIPLTSNPDNLTWADPGERTTLLAAGHPDLRRFLQHAGSSRVPAPTEVLAIRADDGTVRPLFRDPGHRVSAASVAACAGEDLVLGQVFEPAVLRCRIASACGALEER